MMTRDEMWRYMREHHNESACSVFHHYSSYVYRSWSDEQLYRWFCNMCSCFNKLDRDDDWEEETRGY